MTFPTTIISTSDPRLALRDEWVALDRPVDHPYAFAAAELAAQANDRPAIGFRCGNEIVTVEL